MKSDFYFEFENKFRGDEESISKGLGIYDSLIYQTLNYVSNPKILDLGCGRGEFLEKWGKYIPNVLGVENDSKMASICKSKGINIIENNALDALKILPDNSISLITIFHMVEHLEYDHLSKIIFECSRTLQENGVLIIETPNIDNLIVSTNSFYLDHSHKTHINSEAFSFMIEYNGFAKAKYYFLRGGPLQNSEHNKLTRLLNGVAQDLLLVATKSEFMANDLFNINNTWELQLNVGIPTMTAAIEYDLANFKQYQLYDQQLLAQQRLLDRQSKLLDDLNKELLALKSNFEYLTLINQIFRKFSRLVIKFVRQPIVLLLKILAKIFNLILKVPYLKKILLSSNIKKMIHIFLDLLPKYLRLKIIRNIEKKIDKVSEIDSISFYNNKQLMLHYDSSDVAKRFYKNLVNR